MKYRSLLIGLIAVLALGTAACSDDDDDYPDYNWNNGNNNNRVPGYCGDGIIQASEECDDGAGNSDTDPDACRTSCRLPACGDEVVDTGEECEPPGWAGCDGQCLLVTYSCDDASTLDPDCASAPTGQFCWDGGTGGELFCGCNPELGNLHCQLPDTPHCNRATRRCGAAPDCGLDTHEPNDTEAAAASIQLDAAATGVLCHYDLDWYTFTTDTVDATVTIGCRWTSPYDFNLDLTLTDCDGSVIATATSSATDFDSLLLPDLATDTDYCLEVSEASGGLIGLDLTYRLTLDATP